MPQLDKFALAAQVTWFVVIFFLLYFFFILYFLPVASSGLKVRSSYLLSELKNVDAKTKTRGISYSYLMSIDKAFFRYCAEVAVNKKQVIGGHTFQVLRPFVELYVVQTNLGFFVMSWSEFSARFSLQNIFRS